MQIARVIGTVVSTQKHRKFEGAKLLLVQPLNLDDTPRGAALLAVDGVGAGVHEKVLIVLEGRAAGEALGQEGRAGRRGHRRHRRHGGRSMETEQELRALDSRGDRAASRRRPGMPSSVAAGRGPSIRGARRATCRCRSSVAATTTARA